MNSPNEVIEVSVGPLALNTTLYILKLLKSDGIICLLYTL